MEIRNDRGLEKTDGGKRSGVILKVTLPLINECPLMLFKNPSSHVKWCVFWFRVQEFLWTEKEFPMISQAFLLSINKWWWLWRFLLGTSDCLFWHMFTYFLIPQHIQEIEGVVAKWVFLLLSGDSRGDSELRAWGFRDTLEKWTLSRICSIFI